MRIAPQNLDAAENLLSRFLSELWQLCELAVLRDALEIFDRVNPECVVNELDLGGVEAGNTEQVEQSLRDSFAELIQVGRFARLDQLAHNGECRRPDAGRICELTGTNERREIVRVERNQCSGGPA